MNCPDILLRINHIERHIKYEHIFEQIQKQKEFAVLYNKLQSLRDELLKEKYDQDDGDDPDDEEDNLVCPPVAYSTGPCKSGI